MVREENEKKHVFVHFLSRFHLIRTSKRLKKQLHRSNNLMLEPPLTGGIIWWLLEFFFEKILKS